VKIARIRQRGRISPRAAVAAVAAVAVAAVAVGGCGTGSSTHLTADGHSRHTLRPLHDAAPASGTGGGSAVPTPSPQAPVSGLAAAIPTFPTAPPPVPISLPAGPGAPFLSRIPTDAPVAFLTIDDGWTKRPEAIELMAAAHVPVTLFLTINAIRSDPAYFTKLQSSGAVIEAHTITHRALPGMSYAAQRQEICGSADQLGQLYGRRPVLFRPPFGSKDATTLKAAHDCGMTATFFWKETVNEGIVRFQEGHAIQRGDIILMHFRQAFVADFLAALRAISAAGLTPALLEDYLPK
jgi:peptidoglycan/xylan/chitin deacetylase (PgdA/CDA1 family)